MTQFLAFVRGYMAAGLLLMGVAPAKADFKGALASRLSADPSFLVVNLPPRPDAWPGEIFTWNMRVPIKHGDPNDAALRRGPPVAIDATETLDASATARGGYASWFGISASAADAATVSITLPNARIVDMDFGDLVKHVQESPEAIAAAKRGQAPVLVIKSYEGTPVITLTKKANASGEAWAKLEEQAKVDAQAKIASGTMIKYTGSQPIVFAFETQQVDFDLNDLSKGKVTVRLASLPAKIFAFREEESDRIFTATTGVSKDDIWKYAIMGGEASQYKQKIGCNLLGFSC